MEAKLGVIGGMGPEATVYFYEEVTAATVASSDQEHIDLVILSHASMPDRTEAILTGNTAAVAAELAADARTLGELGVGPEQIPGLLETLEKNKGAVFGDFRRLTMEDARAIYESAL